MTEEAQTANPEPAVVGVRRRIRQAAGGSSYRALARDTGCNPETVRRYMQSGTPSLEFVMAVCQGWNLNANWVLFGVGPQHGQDLTSHVLCEFKAESVREVVSVVVQAIGEGLQGLREPAAPTERQLGSSANGQELRPVVMHPPNQNGPRIVVSP